MSCHGANPIFFNKNIKIEHPKHSLNLHPHTSNNISFLPYSQPSLRVDVIFVSLFMKCMWFRICVVGSLSNTYFYKSSTYVKLNLRNSSPEVFVLKSLRCLKYLHPLRLLLILGNISKFLFSRTSCERFFWNLPEKKKGKKKREKVKMLNYIQIFIAVCFYFSDILPKSFKLEYQKKTADNRNYKSCTKNVEKYFPLSVKRNAFACESVWDFQQIIF